MRGRCIATIIFGSIAVLSGFGDVSAADQWPRIYPWDIVGSIERESPRVIGVRKNARGETVQEFVYQENCAMSLPFLGPHGLATLPIRRWHYCYLREPGRPQRELVFLRNVDVTPFECAAVANTNLWTMNTTGRSAPVPAALPSNAMPSPEERLLLEVLTFDEARIIRRHELGVDLDWEHGPYPLTKFESGNRILVYRSIRGLKAYDVVTGAITPWTKDWDASEPTIPDGHRRSKSK